MNATKGKLMSENPVSKAKASVCDRIGANIYGRAEVFLSLAERGDMKAARRELLALLRFFPK